MLLLGFILLAVCQLVLCGDEAASPTTTTPRPDVDGGGSPHSSSASPGPGSNVTTTGGHSSSTISPPAGNGTTTHSGSTTSSGAHVNKTSTEAPPSTEKGSTPEVDPAVFTKEYKNASLIMRRISPKENKQIQELCASNSAYNPVSLRLPGNKDLCAATLISSRHLLTTRNCFIDLEAEKGVKGSVELAWPTVEGSGYTLPTDFERAFYVWDTAGEAQESVDLALIQLLEDVDFSKTKVRPACLPTPDADTEKGNFTVPLLGVNDAVSSAKFEKVGEAPALHRRRRDAAAASSLEVENILNSEANDDPAGAADAAKGTTESVSPTTSTPHKHDPPSGDCDQAGVQCMITTEEVNVLRGAGVYNDADPHTLYGFAVRVANGTRIGVRKLDNKDLLFNLCFYTGACSTPELENNRDNEGRLTLYLDMAYLPALHTHEPPKTTSPTGHSNDPETTSHSGTHSLPANSTSEPSPTTSALPGNGTSTSAAPDHSPTSAHSSTTSHTKQTEHTGKPGDKTTSEKPKGGGHEEKSVAEDAGDS